MTTPCRLVGLGAAIICLTPRIKTVESFFSCPTRSCFGFTTCNHDSPVSSKTRPSCRRIGSLVRARSDSFAAVDNPTHGKEVDGSSPAESREGRDGDGGEEQAASKLGPTSAPEGIVRPKPAWVEDPTESRVKGWIRSVGGGLERSKACKNGLYLTVDESKKFKESDVSFPSIRDPNEGLQTWHELTTGCEGMVFFCPKDVPQVVRKLLVE